MGAEDAHVKSIISISNQVNYLATFMSQSTPALDNNRVSIPSAFKLKSHLEAWVLKAVRDMQLKND